MTAQLKARAITVKTGTIDDATIIASASEDDGDGRWVKHRGKQATHGFKAHVGCDVDDALVEQVSVTPANINDGRAGSEGALGLMSAARNLHGIATERTLNRRLMSGFTVSTASGAFWAPARCVF